MTDPQFAEWLLGFALGRSPLWAGAAALLWAAARRWRADRTAASLLAAAALLAVGADVLDASPRFPPAVADWIRAVRHAAGGRSVAPWLWTLAAVCAVAAVWRGGHRDLVPGGPEPPAPFPRESPR